MARIRSKSRCKLWGAYFLSGVKYFRSFFDGANTLAQEKRRLNEQLRMNNVRIPEGDPAAG
jgi:hypothetical protein